MFCLTQNHTKNPVHRLLSPWKQQWPGCLWEPHVQHQHEGCGRKGCSIRSQPKYCLHHGLTIDYPHFNLMTQTSNGTTFVWGCGSWSCTLRLKPHRSQQHALLYRWWKTFSPSSETWSSQWGCCPLETKPQRLFLSFTAFLYPQMRFKQIRTKTCLLPLTNAYTDVTSRERKRMRPKHSGCYPSLTQRPSWSWIDYNLTDTLYLNVSFIPTHFL